MTIGEARKDVLKIEKSIGDDEIAHSMEDNLHIRFIRDAAKDGDIVAKEVLKTLELDFHRWCA